MPVPSSLFLGEEPTRSSCLGRLANFCPRCLDISSWRSGRFLARSHNRYSNAWARSTLRRGSTSGDARPRRWLSLSMRLLPSLSPPVLTCVKANPIGSAVGQALSPLITPTRVLLDAPPSSPRLCLTSTSRGSPSSMCGAGDRPFVDARRERPSLR